MPSPAFPSLIRLVPLVLASILGACTTIVVPPAAPAAAPDLTSPAIASSAIAPEAGWPMPDLVPRMAVRPRVTVMPIFFLPRGAGRYDLARGTQLLEQHLEVARAHYQRLLGTTFEVAPGPAAVYHAEHDHAYYNTSPETGERVHRVLGELFRWRGADRYTTDHVFLVLYASTGSPIAGGGMPFNGTLSSGGGFAELDLAALYSDRPYPFQSSLVHELGHAFGLPHVDCHGYDLNHNDSIMSYDRKHWSQGLTPSATPGGFMPEEYLMLSYNQRVFPGLTYDATRHSTQPDLARLQACFSWPMGQDVGSYVDLPGVGFELYYDGKRVNGPDASLYSRKAAEESCRKSKEMVPNVRVECRYNGQPF